MPNYTQWPGLLDAQGILVSAGLWPTDSGQQAAAQTQLLIALDARIEQVHRVTGWMPFLAWLRGTVTKTVSGATITGDNTRFLEDGYVTVGDTLRIPGGGGTDSGVVASIDSDTQLTLTAPVAYSATSMQAYALQTRRVEDQPDPNGRLNLRAGLVDVAANVPQVQYRDTSGAVAYSYSLSLPDQNCFLRQSDAQNQRHPYDQIYFPWTGANRFRPWPNLLTVTGRWGFCLSLPADLWLAVAEAAAASGLKRMTQSSQGNVQSESQEGFSQTFGNNLGPIDRINEWEGNFSAVCRRYERAVC